MSDLLVRWATRWDRKAVVQGLLALAREQGAEAEADALGAAFDYSLSSPRTSRFAVAERAGRVVATASLHEGFSVRENCAFGIVQDLWVQPGEQQAETAAELLSLLLGEARRRGHCRVELQVAEEDDAAWHLYESCGFRFTGQLVYAKELQESPS